MAEQLLEEVRYERNETDRARKLQEAQLHATLALVAATIQGGGIGEKQRRAWELHGLNII